MTAARAALLFDLDGTLIDSDPMHFVAFEQVFAPLGVVIDQESYNARIHGSSNEAIGKSFLPNLSPERRREALDAKEAAYRAALVDVEPTPGVVGLLDFADQIGLKRAVVTNGPRANADAALSALGLAGRLTIVVAGADLARAKPDPLPYLRALELTGATAGRSIAFEDSPTGVRSAFAAGLAVVGVTTSLDEATLKQAGAAFAVADFNDSRIRELIEARAGVVGA